MSWQVTKAYRAKSIAGIALKRCWRGVTLQEMQACKAKYKEASRTFTKVKDAEVRKMFRMKMEAQAAKELPQLSKQAHQAFKYVTGSASKGDGLGNMATRITPSGTTVARGHKAAGDLVSSYTRTTGSAATAEGPGSSVRTFGPPSLQL